LDPKLLEALFVQAPLGHQSFHPGLHLGATKGLCVESKQKALRRLDLQLVNYNVRTVSRVERTEMVSDQAMACGYTRR